MDSCFSNLHKSTLCYTLHNYLQYAISKQHKKSEVSNVFQTIAAQIQKATEERKEDPEKKRSKSKPQLTQPTEQFITVCIQASLHKGDPIPGLKDPVLPKQYADQIQTAPTDPTNNFSEQYLDYLFTVVFDIIAQKPKYLKNKLDVAGKHSILM